MKSSKFDHLEELYAPYRTCTRLLVENGSKNIIFGEGSPDAKIMFIGEAPGANEDKLGRPFVGRSGKLLNKILESAGLKREEVFITNIVKVRPPNNRKPYPQELQRGRDLLFHQIDIIKPKVICTLGASALEGLLDKKVAMKQMRGTPFTLHGTTIFPTFHPAFILRNPKELETLVADIFRACELAQE